MKKDSRVSIISLLIVTLMFVVGCFLPSSLALLYVLINREALGFWFIPLLIITVAKLLSEAFMLSKCWCEPQTEKEEETNNENYD